MPFVIRYRRLFLFGYNELLALDWLVLVPEAAPVEPASTVSVPVPNTVRVVKGRERGDVRGRDARRSCTKLEVRVAGGEAVCE